MLTEVQITNNLYHLKQKIDQMLKNLNLSTFDALWLSYVEGMAIGGIIMLIIS